MAEQKAAEQNFERFTDWKNPRAVEPCVTIKPSGAISFNGGCVDLMDIAKKSYVVFYVNGSSRVIAFSFTSDATEPGARKLSRPVKTARSYSVNAGRLLQHLKIATDKPIYMTPRRAGKDGYWKVDASGK